jgi:hypothetical protein
VTVANFANELVAISECCNERRRDFVLGCHKDG